MGEGGGCLYRDLFSSKQLAGPSCSRWHTVGWKICSVYLFQLQLYLRCAHIVFVYGGYYICVAFVMYLYCRQGVGGKIAKRAHSIGNAQRCQMAIKRDERIHTSASFKIGSLRNPSNPWLPFKPHSIALEVFALTEPKLSSQQYEIKGEVRRKKIIGSKFVSDPN